jgi:serine phosphatase RsbU (regulator of sigma subunit)/integral membrane sensor domain MASE1
VKGYAVRVLCLAAAYYGAAKLGLNLAFATSSVTAVWPPTGIALAALVLWGYRFWPGVALGALFANLWTGVPLYTVLGITAGNTLEALAGAFLLLRVAGFRPSLERVRDVIALIVFAAAASTTISATIGVSSLLAAGEIDAAAFGSVWRTWWLGDAGGDLIVAPALMVAVTHWPFRRSPGGLAEAVAMGLATIGVTAFVFSQDQGLTYLIFPVLVWAALRFWQPGAAGASLLVAAVAVPLTERDLGPFAGSSPDDRLLLAQTFVGVAGISALALAAVVTERWRAEVAAGRIAATLQESLLPSVLPTIPGVDVAASFRPAGKRHIVGGDFYDVFHNEDGSWGVVVGDVCGKGAPAAALTGLARHTLRAAATQERAPSRILALLNLAILRQSPNEFCTVVYGRLQAADGAGLRMTLSNGGHPLPLVLRASGEVEPVGVHGTLLGVTSEPPLDDHELELAPGDALLLYTDGLTDASAPRRVVTTTELASRLASCDGRPASEIVEALQRAIVDLDDGEPRDDIAVMVLRAPARDS